MGRHLIVGAAQMQAADPYEGRTAIVKRMIGLMREAKSRGCDLVVFPELALTPFFVVYWLDDISEADGYYEREMPGPETRPLFAEAVRLEIGFYLGYAEYAEGQGEVRRYNTSILVDKSGKIIGKYRKVHLPGYAKYRPELPFQGLEKKYFDVGNYGFNTWDTMGGRMGMCICNDRRWPETFRVMGLMDVEMVLVGYNTPTTMPWDTTFDDLTYFHNHLVLQAAAYQNSTWIVAAAKAGKDGPCELIGGSCIVSPSGEIAACAVTKEDELITAVCNLELTRKHKNSVFNFAEHRRAEHYTLICSSARADEP